MKRQLCFGIISGLLLTLAGAFTAWADITNHALAATGALVITVNSGYALAKGLSRSPEKPLINLALNPTSEPKT